MDLVHLLIYLLILCLILYVFWWALNRIALPEPIKTIVVVVVAIIIILVLLSLIGVLPGGSIRLGYLLTHGRILIT